MSDKKTEEIANYLKDKGIISDISSFKDELEKHIEKKNENPENDVDKWIKVLNNLVEWANEGNQDITVKK